jgi:hypothetical protein
MPAKGSGLPWTERFKTHVDQRGPDECWIWTAARDKDGYGFLVKSDWEGKNKEGAHRLAWILEHGPIPKGLWVLHTCDNPPCCNPRHLFLGTVLDNKRDSISKGRHPHGETHGLAKLTEDKVILIRQLHADGYLRKRLARKFDVSYSLIQKIIQEVQWRHV